MVEEKVSETVPGTKKENKPVTKTAIEEEIKKFIASGEVPRSVSIILQKPFELTDQTQIVIPITNPVEEPMMKNIEPRLLEFLRENLSNSLIDISYDLAVQEQSNKPYTNTERFNAMIDKNPALGRLRDVLGLDPDF